MVASNQQAGISTDAVSTLLQVRRDAVSDSQCPNPNPDPIFFYHRNWKKFPVQI
jgi:hypothetical protein